MNKEINLKTRAYYSNITSLDFRPKKIRSITYKLLYKKGDVIPLEKKIFGKAETKYAETDLYERDDGHVSKSLISPEDYAKNNGFRYNHDLNEVYTPAKVTIGFVDKHTETYSFDEDKDGIEFIEEIKIKCKKCNNELL